MTLDGRCRRMDRRGDAGSRGLSMGRAVAMMLGSALGSLPSAAVSNLPYPANVAHAPIDPRGLPQGDDATTGVDPARHGVLHEARLCLRASCPCPLLAGRRHRPVRHGPSSTASRCSPRSSGPNGQLAITGFSLMLGFGSPVHRARGRSPPVPARSSALLLQASRSSSAWPRCFILIRDPARPPSAWSRSRCRFRPRRACAKRAPDPVEPAPSAHPYPHIDRRNLRDDQRTAP